MDELSGRITATDGGAFALRKGDTVLVSGAVRLDGWYTVRKVRGLWRHRLLSWYSARVYRLRVSIFRIIGWILRHG